MDDLDARTIQAALDHLELPVPATVAKAEAVLAAATALRVQVAAEQAPAEVSLADVRSVGKLFDALVTYASTHTAAVDAAARVEQIAEQQRLTGWMSATTVLMTTLGVAFNKYAATFTAAARKLDGDMDPGRAIGHGLADVHREATAAAGTLSILRAARDALANTSGRTGILPHQLDSLGRVIRVASMEHIMRVIPIRVDRPGRVRAMVGDARNDTRRHA